MGGLTFIIYVTGTNINIDFINAFVDTKHRGPDDSNIVRLSTDNLNNLSYTQQQQVYLHLTKDQIKTYKQYNFIFGYHRLSINDLSYNALQPFEDPIPYKMIKYSDLRSRPNRRLLCNGEIYNYQQLVTENEFADKDLASNCDVEIIMPMYIKYGLEELLKQINGEFAFIITENLNTYELNKLNIFVCRDYLGMKPLYYVKQARDNLFMFVSEIKGLPKSIIQNNDYSIGHVIPGTYWSFQQSIIDKNDNFIQYYSLDKYKDIANCSITSTQPDILMDVYTNLQNIITQIIIERFNNSHQPVGILLSGGFDSCLITSLLVKYLVSINHDFTQYPVHAFTIGDALGSDDIDCEYAKIFVEFLENKYSIDIHHHIVNINNTNILPSDIEDIIYHLESYDPETVRESIPFHYLLNYIKTQTNVKVLLSGDGLDELGSYEQFETLSDELFQIKSVELLQNMYKFDLLRLDKISNMHSLEIRHPFLDKKFIEYALTLHPKLRRSGFYSTNKKIDKYLLRKTFDKSVYNELLIPDSIIWREHHCLCHSFTNFELRLTNYINDNLISDDKYNTNLDILLHEPGNNIKTIPKNKEEMYYRLIFRKLYPNRDNLVDMFWDNIWEIT